MTSSISGSGPAPAHATTAALARPDVTSTRRQSMAKKARRRRPGRRARQPRQAPQLLITDQQTRGPRWPDTRWPGSDRGPGPPCASARSVRVSRPSSRDSLVSNTTSLGQSRRSRSRNSSGARSSPQHRATSAFTSCSMPYSRRQGPHSSRWCRISSGAHRRTPGRGRDRPRRAPRGSPSRAALHSSRSHLPAGGGGRTLRRARRLNARAPAAYCSSSLRRLRRPRCRRDITVPIGVPMMSAISL